MNLDHSAGSGSRGDLGSDAGRALQRFTRDLVLTLFLRRDTFWETVREIRSMWDIEPVVGLPPERPRLLYPEGVSGSEDHEARRRWERELRAVVHGTIPPRHNHKDLEREWRSIVSAFVFYDPPETCLLAFADRCVPRPHGLVPTGRNFPTRDEDESLPIMRAPPVRRLRDADAAEHTERWFWRRVLDEIGRRHLEPLGLDVWELHDDVVDNSPDLTREYRQRQGRNRQRGYISVDEHTTIRDVQRAFHMLAANRRSKPHAGAPRRDPLVALQCAILHDRHNERDTDDRRRKKWAYTSLSKEFGLLGAQAARDHVSQGRELLRNNPQP